VLSGVRSAGLRPGLECGSRGKRRGRTSQDFGKPLPTHELTPDLYPNRGGLGLVRLYHRVCKCGALVVVRAFRYCRLEQSRTGICARYAAVQVIAGLQPISSSPLLSAPANSVIASLNSPASRDAAGRYILPTVTMSTRIALRRRPWSTASRNPSGMVPARSGVSVLVVFTRTLESSTPSRSCVARIIRRFAAAAPAAFKSSFVKPFSFKRCVTSRHSAYRVT